MQPYLHDLVAVISAPLQFWSTADGQARAGAAQGIYCGDDLVLAGVALDVTSHRWDALGHEASGSHALFRWLLRTPDEGADPVVSLTRDRTLEGERLSERIILESAATRTQKVDLVMRLDMRTATMHSVKAGQGLSAPASAPGCDGSWSWRDDDTSATIESDGEFSATTREIRWSVDLEPGSRRELHWGLSLRDADFPFRAPDVRITPRIDRTGLMPSAVKLLETASADLAGLQLCERDAAEHQFCAAGAPWFFTLFGRDSLITATLAAQACPDLAWRTLHTLAARQGTQTNVDTAEEPGKILHEVRRATNDLHDGGTVLPSEYFGTIDATLLWVMLLGKMSSMPETADRQILGLFDPFLDAMRWLRDYADSDNDGFLEYFDQSGHGLANQGWKDSGDSIRFSDGTIATGPIRLLEVQGYAFAAARTAADLLRRFGRTSEERDQSGFWDSYADSMAERVRHHFWLEDERGPYMALALDANRDAVDGVASNMGHLLGLGMLTREEEQLVVARLMDDTMFSGYGIRTMSTTNRAYWPLRYHVGSVWTHDTGWILAGMLASGFVAEAKLLAEGLLRCGEGMDFRSAELFSGHPAEECYPPIPYPASCRPQAWAAASAFVVAEALRS